MRVSLSAAVLLCAGNIYGQLQKADGRSSSVAKVIPSAVEVAGPGAAMTGKGALKPTKDKALGEKVLGVTTYDLQSNNSIHDRIAMDTSGNISVVWTASLENTSTWDDRGAGYSYYDADGETWTLSPRYPRVETARCGWPSILYDADGGEHIISHNTVSEVLKLNSRAVRGDDSSPWTEKTISTSNGYMLWNRAAMGGANGNTMHIVAQEYGPDSANFQNIYNAIVYYRSQNKGQSFDIVEQILPGLDSASVGVGQVISADACAIATNGDHIAIGVFNFCNDVILVESFNNGTSWTSKVVYDFPYKGFDDFWANYDTLGLGADAYLETSDATGTITIDDNDVVHMAWGRMKIVNDVTQPGYYSYLTFVDSLRYYRNSSPAYNGFAGNWVDANNDSMFLSTRGYYRYANIVSYPNIASGNDSLYMVYAGITDTTVSGIDQTTRLFHVFLVRSGDDGVTWSEPVDLTPYGGFDECVYGDIYGKVDDRIRVVYQKDAYPSIYVSYASATNPSTNYTWQQTPSDNDIVYLEITLGGQGIGIGLEKVLNRNESGVYPNPSEGIIDLNLVVYQDLDVAITVHDMNGRVVHTYPGKVEKGRNEIRMDLSHLQPGTYIINMLADGEVLTEKVMIK